MLVIWRRFSAIICSVALLLLAACGKPATPAAKAIPATAAFTITSGHSFTPFIKAVPANTTVAFINQDTVNHDLVSTDPSTAFLNPNAFSSMLAPQSEQETTFVPPGVYDIYDDVFDTWNADQNRVAALQNVPIAGPSPFPTTIEAILWVQGAISGLPSSAQVTFTTATANFDTNVVAITKGGTVSWTTDGQTPVVIQTVPGWSAPINPVPIPQTTITGTAATVTFATPGLYYYYSPTYATVDPSSHRAVAQVHSQDYPIPVEGFVLVI